MWTNTWGIWEAMSLHVGDPASKLQVILDLIVSVVIKVHPADHKPAAHKTHDGKDRQVQG